MQSKSYSFTSSSSSSSSNASRKVGRYVIGQRLVWPFNVDTDYFFKK